MDIMDIAIAKQLSGGGNGGDNAVFCTLEIDEEHDTMTSTLTAGELETALKNGKIIYFCATHEETGAEQSSILSSFFHDDVQGYLFVAMLNGMQTYLTAATEDDYLVNTQGPK